MESGTTDLTPMSTRATVFAHFDPAGEVRSDLLSLVGRFSALSQKTVFVSTNLNATSRARLEGVCEVLERPNEGYDFYSYKEGLAKIGNWDQYDEVVLINSSFVILNEDQLVSAFLAYPRSGHPVFSLSRNREMADHLQSYFLTFSREVLSLSEFASWWKQVEPINDRQEVINVYELGLSTLLQTQGIELNSVFSPTPEEIEEATQMFYKLYGFKPGERIYNPTHFNWKALLRETGIVKIELIRKNPHGITLRELYRCIDKYQFGIIKSAGQGRRWRDRLRPIYRLNVTRVRFAVRSVKSLCRLWWSGTCFGPGRGQN